MEFIGSETPTDNSSMPFNSIVFVIFFISVLALFCLLPQRFRIHLLGASSLLFYGYTNLLNILFLLLVLLVLIVYSNWYSSFSKNAPSVSIGLVIGLLLVAKYFPYTGSHWLLSKHESFLLLVAAPIGISFYSLQAVGYILDIKDGRILPERNVLKLTTFLAFFPQALAGPIHRYKELMPQLSKLDIPTFHYLISGIKIILWGYFCKLIIADKIALIITPILSNPESGNGLSISVSAILYSFQIYFDFYGYTLIAIGVASMFGIKLNENFNRPYSVTSFREFWRRWHITLSKWFRDYVYLRLGGRGNSYAKFLLVVAITFLLSGFWHGLTANYLLWGLLHATFYVVEDIVTKATRSYRLARYKVISIFKQILFFSLITLSWLVFRTTNLNQLELLFGKIFNFKQWSINSLLPYLENIYFSFLLLIGGVILCDLDKLVKHIAISRPTTIQERGVEGLYIVCCVLLILIFGDLGIQEFLYFQF